MHGSGEVSVYSPVAVSAGNFGFKLRIRMWSSGSSSQQNKEGWEMASYCKTKNQAPPTAVANRPRGDTYSIDMPGNGAWKGRGSYNIDDQKTGHWVNPSSNGD